MQTLLYCFFTLLCNLDTSGNSDIGKFHLNDISQKACHNCYDLKYSTSISDVLDNVHNIEIDFYDSKNIIFIKKSAVPFHWFVRHDGVNKMGNSNCCYSSVTGANDLDSCLKDVARWCTKYPHHELITIFFDKKQSWSANHSPTDLDNLILKYFKRELIFKPTDLKASYASIRDAAKAGAWPTFGKLKGKVIFSLTGGNFLNPNKTLSQYIAARKDTGLIFMAPEIKREAEIYIHPKGFIQADQPYVVFYNFNIKHSSLACITKREKYISRVFNVKEDKINVDQQQSCANYVAVFDYVNTVFSSYNIINNENR
jgi:hypothetical protein